MTLINVISSAIYLKGFPTKTKVQLYAMALFFLVFLYGSPAGLVFYWTLNNIFSLIKTLFYKMKNPGRILRVLASAAGLILAALVMKKMEARLLKYVLIAMCMALQLPLLVSLLRGRSGGRYLPCVGQCLLLACQSQGESPVRAVFLDCLWRRAGELHVLRNGSRCDYPQSAI